MSTIISLIPRIRLELDDKQGNRMKNEDFIFLIREAVEVVNHLLFKNRISEGLTEQNISTVENQSKYDLPDDFMVAQTLVKKAGTLDAQELTQTSNNDWLLVRSTSEATRWRAFNGKLDILSAPASEYVLTLQYWPKVDTDNYDTNTDLPWSGKFDSVLKEYVCVRVRNIDEADNLSNSAEFMRNIEKLLLSTYGAVDGGGSTVVGWLEG